MQLDQIRRLRVEVTETGTADTTKKLNNLGDSYGDVGVQSKEATDATAKFEAANARMQRQMDIAIKQNDSFSRSAAEYAAMAAGLISIGAAVSTFFDRVVDANKILADMQLQARQTGLALADFQGLKLGASIAGIGDGDFNSGLQQSAKLLNDASRNSNTLSKELAENGIAVRNANGQMITQNQLLGIAADLVKRARNPGDQSVIAEMLGFSRAWIPLLEQGGEAMAGLTAEAQRAGAVITDETINRAAEFDRQWRKSSVEFSSYMKSAMLELLPYVDDLIERASKFLKSIDVNAIEKAALEQLKFGAAALSIPDEAAVKVEIPQAVIDNWTNLSGKVTAAAKSLFDFANDDSTWTQIEKIWSLLSSDGPNLANMPATVRSYLPKIEAVPQDVKWYGGTSPVMDTSNEAIQAGKTAAAWIAEGGAYKKFAADVMSGADNISGGFSKVAANSNESKDAYDRAEEALRKYIETTRASAESIDMTTAAQERLKAIAQLTAAGMKDGLTREAAAARAQISGLADDAGKAAAELAKARIESKIKFDAQTALLSSEDVQIARELKGLYPDIATALGSVEADAMRANAQLKSMNDIGRQTVQSFAVDLVAGLRNGQSAMDAIGHSAQSLSTTLTSSAITELLKGNLIGAAAFGLGAIIAGDIGAAQRKRPASKDNEKDQSDDSDHRRAAAAA